MFPVGFDLGLDATRRAAESAQPDAPVLDDTTAAESEATGAPVSGTAERRDASRTTRAA